VDWIGGIGHLPLETLAESIGFDVRHFQDWLDHPSFDAYWEPLDLEARARDMAVPALNIGGWYDVFLRSTIGSYTSMTERAATERARQGQRMIIGPWPHGWNQSQRTGEIDFGEESLVAVDEILLEWFDHWLKDGVAPAGAPIRLFVMGENVWREENEWPLQRTEYRKLYLHADGSLSETVPAPGRATLGYSYDPADPVPTLGGNIMEPTLRGPYDQSPLDERGDILRFVTAPFTEVTEITGPVRAALFAASSAPDTDFMAKLIVVKPDGRAFNLVDGVIRARYREGFESPRLIEPGTVVEYAIDMWATSYVLLPGDRLRVDITSSNFPRLARNLNTGAPFAKTSKMEVAHQTIHVNKRYPSHVVLPFIPR
jgi:putative CocE/NonD family hydrolase